MPLLTFLCLLSAWVLWGWAISTLLSPRWPLLSSLCFGKKSTFPEHT